MDDEILISNLKLSARIGITPEEREKPQRLTVSLTLRPRRDLSTTGDRIENTVDYARVCLRITALASRATRNLVETLADEIARMLLKEFPLKSVEIELRKYILPDTEYVAVKIRREAK
ncbi:MAG TPA: dihydroneopterin aldolase [Chthoniobacteraceae bacterium]|nr:dihydroneopterin aldolase [Chthoniobacteraceae bacterium]